jgi:hypothetical protein
MRPHFKCLKCGATPFQKHFPRYANSRFGPRFRARSPLPDPRWCNACSFRPRSFTPYLATRAYVPGAQPVPPFARLRSGRPLSPHHPLHAQNLKTTDQVPLRRVPIVGLAECLALPVAIVEVCRVQPRTMYKRGWGGVTTCTFIQGRMVTGAASGPCSPQVSRGRV